MSDNDYTASGPGDGNKNVAAAGTPERLNATRIPCRNVAITARPANTGKIAVGMSNAVRAVAAGEKGVILAAGSSVSFPVASVSDLWIDATVNGEGVSYTYQ